MNASSELNARKFDTHTHTHEYIQQFHSSLDFVSDNPGELVPEETFTLSYLSWFRDRPKLISINSAETETGPKYSDVVSAENEAEAEFNILFRPIPKQKPKINNAECIT